MALRPKQQKAIDAFIDLGTVTAAAEAANVSRKTIYEWLKDADFRDALRASGDDSIRTMAVQLTAETEASIDRIVQIRDDEKTPASVRLRAADTVLGRVLELRELTIVEDRLSAIETALALRN